MESSLPNRARAVRWGALVIAGGFGCTSTQVTSTTGYAGRLPKPERIVVHRFATSPDEVRLDHSVTATAAWKLQGTSEASERTTSPGRSPTPSRRSS